MERLKTWLTEQKMTQTDFARQMGLAQEHVNRVLNGKMPMSDGFRWRFGELYGFDTAQTLLCEEEAA